MMPEQTPLLAPRFSRLARYAGLAATLPRWQAACCAVVGLGGLGGGLALQLARMGVRRLLLLDRDIVGPENLGHQALFTEAQAAAGLPKAQAAAETLAGINSAVELVPLSASLSRHNIAQLLAGAELIFDGLDNYYARFLLNDYALSQKLPYMYAGVVRGELSCHAVQPGVTACLRCLLAGPPPAGSVPTCAAEGVFAPLLAVANALQLDAANRLLAGGFTAADDVVYSLNTADWHLRQVRLGGPQRACPACAGRYEYLSGLLDAQAQAGCAPEEHELQLAAVDLASVGARLAAAGGFAVRSNRFCVSAETPDRRYTIFASGRVVHSGPGGSEGLERFVAEYLGI